MSLENIRKMTVREIMKKHDAVLKTTDKVEKAAKLLASNELSMVPVEDESRKFLGSVVERDLLKIIIDPKSFSAQEVMMDPILGMSFMPESVKDVMRKNNLTLSPEDTVEFAAKQLYKTKSPIVPVIENNEVIGLLFEDDLINLLAE